jgi:aspartyl-tRNA(Asn)/glutamyl-tRNA(Gln) amidotransferase subunit A
MSDEDLCFATVATLRALLDSREISAVELAEVVLRRMESLEPTLNGMSTVTADLAMAQARQADARPATDRGGDDVPLSGIPVTIKDLHMVAGYPVQSGSRIFADRIAEADSPFVARLKDAGAVILGKTTTPEFGWKGVSESPLTGITSNPWRAGYNAGASSSGAGVGAAAGYGPLHQGSDGAGSVRMPAHFCGVFGLKPTYGRIPNWPVPNNDQGSHVGPITRTVGDSAAMLKVMAGPHHLDHTSLEADPADYPGRLESTLQGRRIAFSPDLGHARVDPEVARLVADAVRAFEDMGCQVEEVTPDFGTLGPELGRFFWCAHEQVMGCYVEEHEAVMDPGLVACIREGEGTTVVDYLRMRERKYRYVNQIHSFMENWDLLLTPAVSVAAFPADQLQPDHWPAHAWDWLRWAEFSYPFNMSGSPAASVPCGMTAGGLPVGLQIVGKRFDDLGVLQASAAFEAMRPWAFARDPAR